MKLLVIGGTGEMGHRIIRLAREYLRDVEVSGGCRRPPMEPGWRQVDICDADSVSRALEDVAIVINAVGPYNYDPAPLVQGCLDRAVDYIDLADDPTYVTRVQQLALESNSCSVLPGCSTVPGMVDVLVDSWPHASLAAIDIHLSMGSRNPVSRGLLFSLLRPLGTIGADGTRYFTRLERVRLTDGVHRSFGRYPSVYDASWRREPDAAVPPRRFHVGFDRGYVNMLLRHAARVMPSVSDETLHRLCKLAIRVANVWRWCGTAHGWLRVQGINASGDPVNSYLIHAQNNGLDVPALPSVWAAECLLQRKPASAAVRSLSALLTAEDLLERLEHAGYSTRVR